MGVTRTAHMFFLDMSLLRVYGVKHEVWNFQIYKYET
jgi:hypothetical protein